MTFRSINRTGAALVAAPSEMTCPSWHVHTPAVAPFALLRSTILASAAAPRETGEQADALQNACAATSMCRAATCLYSEPEEENDAMFTMPFDDVRKHGDYPWHPLHGKTLRVWRRKREGVEPWSKGSWQLARFVSFRRA